MFRQIPGFAAAFSLFIMAIPAIAADPAPADTPISPKPEAIIDTSQWGGFYIGAYGSYQWFSASVSGQPDVDAEDVGFGGYLGYNKQYENRLVTGLEVLGGFANIEETTGTVTIEQEWDASLRARLGYAFESSLIYSFAGLAVTSLEARSLTGVDEETLTGFNVGAGLEFELFDDVTGRLEYGYDEFGEEGFALGGTGDTFIDADKHDINIGIGLRF